MKKHSLSALAAAGLLAGGLSVTSASAADLGGNCCADLEERIAELEATTARKGNRKVSLTVSGWVAQNITWWDNGEEDNVYVHDSGTTLGSNVKFTGQATIVPGWTAGYVLHMELMGSDSLTMDEDTPNGPALYNLIAGGDTFGNTVQTLQSYWFIKSESLGKVSVGLQSQASDNAAILVDGSGSLVPANWVAFDYRAFGVPTALGTILGAASCGTMGGAIGDCNGLTQNSVRYDTPTFAGFSASASWGADDFWDVAIRYAGEFAGFKLAAAAAYNEVNDQNYNNLGELDADYFQAGLYVQHIGTGLFALANYGLYDDHTPGFEVEQETWYGKVGIRQRWTPLGHTVLYGEYEHTEDAYSGDGEFELWGVGAVQEIDNAAMSLWIKYRDIEADDGPGTEAEFQLFQFGGLINF
jgi:predicted porin